MDSIEILSLIELMNVPGIGPARVRALVSHFRSVEAVLSATVTALCQAPGIERTLAENIHHREAGDFARRQMEILERQSASVMTFWDADYPSLLKRISDPPVLLFFLGTIAPIDQNAVAVVGTRAPTQYGKMVAEKLCGALAARGMTVVSGLARGIDTVAHQTAIKSGGRTLAILGSGLDVIYPAENQKLSAEITHSGAVLSEFAFGAKPDAVNFPRRNRIISGLSVGVVVIEAGLESGAMITANCALEHNREVFAVPGSIFSPKSAGPHQLIREGAKLVQEVDDILEEIHVQTDLFSGAVAEKPAVLELDVQSLSVYNLLSHEPIQIDELNRKLGLPASQLMAVLLDLEFKSIIKQLPGKYFVKL